LTRENLISGGGQRLDPQAAVRFDANRDLAGFLGMGGDQLVEPSNAGESFG
jgi:hypothetical protein